MITAMEPTYFLYSGRLFHESALGSLLAMVGVGGNGPGRGESGPGTSLPKRGEDPTPAGPEGEPVGEDEQVPTSQDNPPGRGEAAPAPAMPMVPGPGAPDANPIDPRVF